MPELLNYGSPTLDAVLGGGLVAALALSDAMKAKVREAVRKYADAGRDRVGLLREARYILAKLDPLMAVTLGDASLAAWLFSQQSLALRAPGLVPERRSEPLFRATEPDEPPLVTYPMRDAAVRDLSERKVLTASEYYTAEAEARATAFTVTGVQSEKALEKIQEALADDVAQGGTLREFEARVDKAVGSGTLSPSHVELVYRVGVGQAVKNGQQRILGNPLVGSAFPYVLWVWTNDKRVRDDHKAMGSAGLDGTGVYRADDPLIQRVWAPFSWACRCHMRNLTLSMAAAMGVREAKEWLRTGVPPRDPQFVASVPILIPAGW
jgi:hypothetical protein